MKVIIVGGVAGGATVAARLRRMDEKAQIIMFERGDYVSYANCGLPYYIGGVIQERDRLFVQTVKGFVDRFNIDIRIQSEVSSINPEKQTVEILNTLTGETYTESYDKLVLSTGAEPLRPPVPGIDDELVFTLRSIPDTDKIKKHLIACKPKNAVVVGGGFIGLEMVENLHEAGLDVSVVEMANQVMAPLDYSMASIVHQELIYKGVELLLDEAVAGFERTGEQIAVKLKSGKTISTDMVIWSIGVRPETKLAKDAGLELGYTGGIKVNHYMQTSNLNIYSLGDATEVLNPVINKHVLIPLAGPANKQGRIVADNIIEGNKYSYDGSIGTSIAKVFDLTVAAAGVSSKVLKREGIEHISSFTHGSSHAGYYPDALPLSIKVIFSPADGRLFGAQVVGFDGVDKRIEMFAQVIRNKGTVYDLMEIEHAYAPPYSSAKDPVNMAGFVAGNILKGKVKIIHWNEIAGLDMTKTILVDVRTKDECELNKIEGSVNIPVDDLRNRLSELPKDKKIVLYCAVGLRGYLASRILLQNGFSEVYNLSGGYKTYSCASQDVNCSFEFAESNEQEPLRDDVPEGKTIVIDACGLQCPGPVMQLKKNYDVIQVGECIEIKSTDQAFAQDVSSWCNMTGAKLLNIENISGIVHAHIQKSGHKGDAKIHSDLKNKTMVVFSDDLDKALASFVIANGAASTGHKVSMFFTFWGLNVIKKQNKPNVQKDFLGKMFSMMLPSGSKKLSLSKMNMGGLGSKMMRRIMKSKNIDSLESLISQAVDNGVEMIACSMSMDVMGIKAEELMDNVTVAGVAAYLERTEKASLNLFI